MPLKRRRRSIISHNNMSKESILGSLKNMRKNLKNRATALETVGAVLLTSLPAFLGISAFLNIMVDHQQFQNYLFLAESIVSGIGIISNPLD